MSDSDIKFYLSGGFGGARTEFFEAPALTDADGNPIGMDIQGWGGIGDLNAGLRYFPVPVFGVGLRVGGIYQGGSVDVLDTIDSDNPEAYYAAAECDKYVDGGVGNVGSAGNCGVGDALDTGTLNWNRVGFSLFVPFSFGLPREFQIEVAPGYQHEWGTGSAQIMISDPDAEGIVDLKNQDSFKFEASAGKYFGNPDEKQLGVFLTWRETLASQGVVYIPGEHRTETIPGAGNHVIMVRVEGEFDIDTGAGGGSVKSIKNKAEARAKRTREKEAAQAKRDAAAQNRKVAATPPVLPPPTAASTATTTTTATKANDTTIFTSAPFEFVSNSAFFNVGETPVFHIKDGTADDIKQINWVKDGKIQQADIDFDTDDTDDTDIFLTVTELADISKKVNTDAITALPGDATSTLRTVTTRNAGKGDYTLVVILKNANEITLTATAE